MVLSLMVLSTTPLWLPGGVIRVLWVVDNAMMVWTVGATLTAMAVLGSALAVVAFLT